jgi:hypothetical protein
MQAYIPAVKLFLPETRCGCKGIVAYDNHRSAGSRTVRLRNTATKNQYVSLHIPEITTFLSLEHAMAQQPSYVLEHILTEKALSTLFTVEGRAFFHNLDRYLAENGLTGDMVTAQTEMMNFYDKKRSAIRELTSSAYISLITQLARGHHPAIVASYLSCFGISGLVFKEPGTPQQNAFLLFNPRRDAVIKEIIRMDIRESRMVS